MSDKKYIVTKNGMVYDCKTEERYNSFIEDGWREYEPSKKTTNRKNKPIQDV